MAEETYGDRLKAARTRKGLSVEQAAFQAQLKLREQVSQRTVGRLEDGTTSEEAANEWLVLALCRVYEVDQYTISVAIADRTHRKHGRNLVLLHGNGDDDNGASGDGPTRRSDQQREAA